VTIGKNCRANPNRLADGALYRKSAPVNLWFDVFNDDAFSAIRG
jgi:hypothetical protein